MTKLNKRFRGFFPVIIDIETSGIKPSKHAILEIAAIPINMDTSGKLIMDETLHYHVEPFENAEFDPDSMAFHNIDPFHPFRMAQSEKTVLNDLFSKLFEKQKNHQCKRSILVGHNAWFDLHFMQAAEKRACIKKSPFHRFSTLDTVSLSALFYGQTVLAKALQSADIGYNPKEAHSALYDAEQTAKLFCQIVNDLHAIKKAQ